MSPVSGVTPDHRDPGRKPPAPGGVPSSLVAALLVILVALIAAAVIVGLVRNNLDPLGVVTVLSTLISGAAVGLNLKGRGNGDGE